jgi:hypothetical protein
MEVELGMWLEKAYKWLWSRVGGEQWTVIVRRAQKNYPLMFLLIFLMAGILLARVCKKYWQILIGFGVGIIIGHFFWW